MKKPDLTLILPCYNEDEHINESIKKIFFELQKLKISWEVIFIDDRSTDNTREMLKLIKKEYNRYNIRIFYHSHNKGRGTTVAEGIFKAKGKIAGYIDIDCEISPIYIKSFINLINESVDMVVAKRKYEFHLKSLHRYLSSSVYAFISKFIFNLPISDSEAGYKFFNTKRIIPILKKTNDNHWFWDTEVVVRTKLANLTIKEFPVIFRRRNDKTSTVKLFSDTIEYIRNLIRLKIELIKRT